MIIVLEERGYIERGEDDLLRLTGKLALLGGARSDNSKLAEIAEPYRQSLVDETDLSNHLSVISENQLLAINCVPANQTYGVVVQVGYRTSLFGSAAGACFLSTIADEERRIAVMSRIFSDYRKKSIADFNAQIVSCMRDGFVNLPSRETVAISEISSLVIHRGNGYAVSALTMPYLATTAIENRLDFITASLRRVCASLSEKITITMSSPGLPAILS